ncbi:aminotransferase class IV [Actinoplanes sp. DH11]|uniref:aminotransferase class IV n=1 Tax=Actinoplanes sp. DH11 TaxID=2857011 RepID=UPI001E37E0DC|nr:aminotransferase class IV [Actinoplanes sp. DH11]
MQIDGRAATAEEVASLALYNYGHFTSMTVERGAVRGLPLHLERLVADCRTLFGADLDTGAVRQSIRSAVDEAAAAVCVVRVTVFAPDLDLARPAAGGTPHMLVVSRAAPEHALPALRLASVRYQRELAEVKHTGLFGAVWHRRAVQLAGADDVVFVDAQGRISEGATWNIGFSDGRRVRWPAGSCLPGVTMRLLTDALTDAGIACDTAPLTLDRDSLGDQVFAFTTNAVAGVRAVRSIDGMTFTPDHPMLETLSTAYRSIPGDRV